jgi:CBS domain-containing protein
MREMKIQNILATKGTGVVTVKSDDSLREAVALLAKFDIGGLVVVDEARRPVGIITERDIVRQAADSEAFFSRPVHEVMTTAVTIATPEDEIESVARTMSEKRFRHLPIMDQGRLVGIVSIGDVVRAQRDHFQGEVYTLHAQMIEEH